MQNSENREKKRIIHTNEGITLYHGSKSGIHGAIAPVSRERCDFGKGCDMIIGYIANDRMFVVLDRFFNGDITDLALINSLSALKLGKQYVALTEKACRKIQILEERELAEEDRRKLKQKSEENRSKGIEMANEICRKYRREGSFFDEILKAGE